MCLKSSKSVRHGEQKTASNFTRTVYSVHLTLLQGAAAVETVWVDRLPPFYSDDILLPLNLCGHCDQFDALASEKRCLCYCNLPNKNSFYEPSGKCAENKQVRDLAGCSFYFFGERPDSQLHLYDPSFVVNDKFLKIPPGKECRVNQEGAGNEYLHCDGAWKRMWPGSIKKKFGSRTLPSNTEWFSVGYTLRVKQDHTGSTDNLNGRIIKLNMQCRPKDGIKTPVDNDCLLFKIKGSVNCPLQNISRPIPLPGDITTNTPLATETQVGPSYVSPTVTATSLEPSTRMTSVLTSLSLNSTTIITTTGPPVKTGNRNSPPGNSARIGIIVGAAVAGCVVLIVVILVLIKVCWARKSRHNGGEHQVNAPSPGTVYEISPQQMEPANNPVSTNQSFMSPREAADAPSLAGYEQLTNFVALYEELNPTTRASLTYDYAEHPEFPFHLLNSTGPSPNAGSVSSAYLEPVDAGETTSPGERSSNPLKRKVHNNIFSKTPTVDRDATFTQGNYVSTITGAHCATPEPEYIDMGRNIQM